MYCDCKIVIQSNSAFINAKSWSYNIKVAFIAVSFNMILYVFALPL